MLLVVHRGCLSTGEQVGEIFWCRWGMNRWLQCEKVTSWYHGVWAASHVWVCKTHICIYFSSITRCGDMSGQSSSWFLPLQLVGPSSWRTQATPSLHYMTGKLVCASSGNTQHLCSSACERQICVFSYKASIPMHACQPRPTG